MTVILVEIVTNIFSDILVNAASILTLTLSKNLQQK